MQSWLRSGFWFSATLLPFVFILFGFFGHALTDSTFWMMALPITGCIVGTGLMRAPLATLDHLPRAVAWFSIGFTAAAFIAIGGGHEFHLTVSIGFGLALAVFELATGSYLREKHQTAD